MISGQKIFFTSEKIALKIVIFWIFVQSFGLGVASKLFSTTNRDKKVNFRLF
jgi:hypothetical protein